MSAASEARPTVLVVEDDRTTRKLLRALLSSWGYPVEEAAGGEEGWQLLTVGAARILLTDWEMPGLDGPTLCRRVRTLPAARYVYAVLVTARDRRDHMVAGLEAGADDFVSKPIHHAELQARLRVACRVLRLEDELRERNDQLRRANETLEELALIDPLMAVGNRRAFELALDRVDSHATRHGQPYGVLMIDVDHFKRFNDHYGHPAGDRALRAVSSAVRGALRREDEVFRYGGEELCVLLPHVGSPADLATIAERVRRAVVELGIEHRLGEHDVLSVTLGGAVHAGASHADAARTIERADSALYQAKSEGRNCFVIGVESAPAAGVVGRARPRLAFAPRCAKMGR